MICIICQYDFEIIKQQGGQNRQLCYNCLPAGLSKDIRNSIKRKLYLEKSRELKQQRGCDYCGYNKFAGALEWHHINNNKELNLADLLKISWNRYIQETEKCILLCANCHREKHDIIKEGVV